MDGNDGKRAYDDEIEEQKETDRAEQQTPIPEGGQEDAPRTRQIVVAERVPDEQNAFQPHADIDADRNGDDPGDVRPDTRRPKRLWQDHNEEKLRHEHRPIGTGE